MAGRSIAHTAFAVLGFSATALLLLACLGYYGLSPLLPLLDALSIVVPGLMGGTLLWALYQGLARRRLPRWPLLVLGLALFSFGTVYEFEPTVEMAGTRGLRLMSFNVRSFEDGRYVKDRDSEDRIAGFVAGEDPDILCVQEFARVKWSAFRQYPYRYLTPPYSGKSTQAIFSKYPILDQGEVPFPDSGNNTLYADILVGPDTLRVYNVHLESYNIGSRRFLWRNYGLDFVRRLKAISKKHMEQARIVKAHQARSPYPTVICGDFNATAFSDTYRVLKRGMQDTFREKGKGWGTTFYLSGAYPFRIDYILADEHFEVLGHRNFGTRLSDHLPLEAALKPKGKQGAVR